MTYRGIAPPERRDGPRGEAGFATRTPLRAPRHPPADPHKLARRPRTIDEHRDRLRYDTVKRRVGKGQGKDVPVSYIHEIAHGAGGDVGPSAFQHPWSDVDSSYAGTKAPRNLDRGRAYTTPYVEHLMLSPKFRLLQELLGGATAARMDDALAEDSHQLVWIERSDLVSSDLRHRHPPFRVECHLPLSAQRPWR